MCSKHGGSPHKSACARKTDATITLNNTVILKLISINTFLIELSGMQV